MTRERAGIRGKMESVRLLTRHKTAGGRVEENGGEELEGARQAKFTHK